MECASRIFNSGPGDAFPRRDVTAVIREKDKEKQTSLQVLQRKEFEIGS